MKTIREEYQKYMDDKYPTLKVFRETPHREVCISYDNFLKYINQKYFNNTLIITYDEDSVPIINSRIGEFYLIDDAEYLDRIFDLCIIKRK